MDELLEPHLVNRSWLDDPALRSLLSMLNDANDETRIIGGAVRNALLGEEIEEVDCATTLYPEDTIARAEAAGFKVVPTGLDHGTVTVIIDGTSFEVTTLRADVETDGRHARVRFGRDWAEDAKRRDFTMNALSIDVDGTVHDPIGGYADIVHRRVQFIGDPETRIHEDYLRILRFFRFFAWYGAGRPDRDALRAIVRTKSGLASLSVERVWQEVKQLLAAPDAERSVLWMRTTEVLDAVLPENWGLDQFHWLLNAEREHGLKPDALRRLQAMLRPATDVVQGLSDRLKLSNDERKRLLDWVLEVSEGRHFASLSVVEFAKVLYRARAGGVADAMAHDFAKAIAKEEAGVDRISALMEFADTWSRPELPVSGEDLIARGHTPGPKLGDALSAIEDTWVESGFVLTKEELLDEY